MITNSLTPPATYGSIPTGEPKDLPHLADSATHTVSDSGMEPFDSPSPFQSPYIRSLDIQSPSDTDGSLYHSSSEDLAIDGDEKRSLLMATALVEDAIEHRSIHHKLDKESLLKYRLYHSKPVRWILRITIAMLLILAFFEKPSSITSTSDPSKRGERPELPCGATESIEFICLLILTADFLFRSLIVGKKRMKQSNWLVACGVCLLVSYLDWLVSLGYICDERWRIRRILRPFFLIQNSSLMKKTVQSIKESMPQILSVLFLMFLQVYFFTMLGMIMFSPQHYNISNNPVEVRVDDLNDKNEGIAYFSDIGAAVISLVVLLTTANNPDVMMPAYSDNRLYSLYFILFLAIGLYFFMNVLLAVIYNQFKGSFTKSMQVSFMRRRIGVRAAYEVLRGFHDNQVDNCTESCSSVLVSEVSKVLEEVRFSKKGRYLPDMNLYLKRISTPAMSVKQFQELFDMPFQDSIKKRHPCRHFNRRSLRRIQAVLLHDYFQYFGDFMSFVNVFVVTIQLASSNRTTFTTHNRLSIFNFCFILYYAVEQILMIVFIGPRRYLSHKNVWFESLVTWLLVLVEILCIGLYGGPFPYLSNDEVIIRSRKYHYFSYFNLLRITNMLIIIRLLRIIPSIKPLKMVASTLVDLAKNMRSFFGILITIYYIFAVVGMMMFEGQSPQPSSNSTLLNNSSRILANETCGTYEQLNYYANNFDDFAASLVLLWDVMVVNNWQVFLDAYSRTQDNRLYQIYFVLWWLVSVVICINLFVALVIEAFITQWDKQVVVKKKHKKRKYAHNEETSRHFRVHEWFRADYREPTEEEVVQELWSQHHLRKHILVRPVEPLRD